MSKEKNQKLKDKVITIGLNNTIIMKLGNKILFFDEGSVDLDETKEYYDTQEEVDYCFDKAKFILEFVKGSNVDNISMLLQEIKDEEPIWSKNKQPLGYEENNNDK